MSGGGGGRRSYGGFDEDRCGGGPPSRADDVDNWALGKKPLPSFQSQYGSLGGGSRADGKKPIPVRVGAGGGLRELERERPKLVLDPPKRVIGLSEPVKTNRPNPFGAARPREEVLAEKGLDWKKLDLEIDAKKVTSSPTTAHSSSSSTSKEKQEVTTQEEVDGALETLRTLLEKPAVEVFNTPAYRDQFRQLVIMLSTHYTSMENRIILDDFSSRLPEYEKSILAALSTRDFALAFQDSNRLRVNELDTVLEQGRTSLSSLQDKLDELTQGHDTLVELIQKLEAERDQFQTSITETTTQLENLSGQVSSDYQAWKELQEESIKVDNELFHSENTIAGVELAWSTLKRRLFTPSN